MGPAGTDVACVRALLGFYASRDGAPAAHGRASGYGRYCRPSPMQEVDVATPTSRSSIDSRHAHRDPADDHRSWGGLPIALDATAGERERGFPSNRCADRAGAP